jgi:hypothetical protein
VTTTFQNLNQLDDEAERLFDAGEMTEERFRALLEVGLSLGYRLGSMDVLIGLGDSEWFSRFAAELAEKRKQPA